MPCTAVALTLSPARLIWEGYTVCSGVTRSDSRDLGGRILGGPLGTTLANDARSRQANRLDCRHAADQTKLQHTLRTRRLGVRVRPSAPGQGQLSAHPEQSRRWFGSHPGNQSPSESCRTGWAAGREAVGVAIHVSRVEMA